MDKHHNHIRASNEPALSVLSTLLFPNPLPNLHKRLPQQIQPPPLPLLTGPLRPKPNPPNPIPRTRLHNLLLTSSQQLPLQFLVLRKFKIVPLHDDREAVLFPDFVGEVGDFAAQGTEVAGVRDGSGGVFGDDGVDDGVGGSEEEGFVVHHVPTL